MARPLTCQNTPPSRRAIGLRRTAAWPAPVHTTVQAASGSRTRNVPPNARAASVRSPPTKTCCTIRFLVGHVDGPTAGAGDAKNVVDFEGSTGAGTSTRPRPGSCPSSRVVPPRRARHRPSPRRPPASSGSAVGGVDAADAATARAGPPRTAAAAGRRRPRPRGPRPRPRRTPRDRPYRRSPRTRRRPRRDDELAVASGPRRRRRGRFDESCSVIGSGARTPEWGR